MSKNNKGQQGGCDHNLNCRKDGPNGVEAQSCYELPPNDVCGPPISSSILQYDGLDYTTVANGPDYQEILQSQKEETPITFMNRDGAKFTGVVVMIDFTVSNRRGTNWISLAIALGGKAIALFIYNTAVRIGGEIKILTDENDNV